MLVHDQPGGNQTDTFVATRHIDDESLAITVQATARALLEAPNLDLDTSFFDAGADSLRLVMIAGMLSEQLGIDVLPETLFDCDTIAGLTRALVDELRNASR